MLAFSYTIAMYTGPDPENLCLVSVINMIYFCHAYILEVPRKKGSFLQSLDLFLYTTTLLCFLQTWFFFMLPAVTGTI